MLLSVLGILFPVVLLLALGVDAGKWVIPDGKRNGKS